MISNYRLFTSSFTSFLTYHFTRIPNTFSFVWFRFAKAADLGSNLSNQLTVDTFKADRWVLSFLLCSGHLQFFRNFEDDIVRISECEVKHIALVSRFETYTN